MEKTLLSILILASIFSCNSNTKFELLDPSETGIHFSNRIFENDSINILSFDYVYNGGGVGIGDFNKDGLQDIFFSANMNGNKLYLNKGNFKFDDITEQAGIINNKKWHTGAIIVDINQDGLDDIYVPVSSTTKSDSSLRENLLYVNQGIENGIPTFKEQAKQYGVNDFGHSESAAFFDYDNDGDLDLYVVTNVMDRSPNYFREKVLDGSYPNTDRLYRNDFNDSLNHAVFSNVSTEAGIVVEGFGLGINITDINKDGWKDIYVTNDYAADDILYINNQNGTFTDQAKAYFKHTSNSAMGNDIADINNDGLVDVLALDMLPEANSRKKVFSPPMNEGSLVLSNKKGYTNQYMRNTLQLNSGLDANFQEIGLMVGIGETDWSWTPSLADFDNDTDRDLLVSNGFPKDVTDKDFMNYRAESERLMDRKSLIKHIPEVKIANYGFQNNGNLEFENKTEDWGLNIPSYSSGAAYADLDNDGDLDYIVNNTNDSAFVFKNTTFKENGNTNYIKLKFEGSNKGIGVIVSGKLNDSTNFYFENNPFRGYKSTIENVCHIGLGELLKADSLNILWPNGNSEILLNTAANSSILVKESNASPQNKIEKPEELLLFTEHESPDLRYEEFNFSDFNAQNLMPFKLSRQGPALAVADINLDGLDDFYMGAPKFRKGKLMVQKAEGGFSSVDLDLKQDSTKKLNEETGVLFFDANNDNYPDLYIASGGNENFPDSPGFKDRLFINDKNGGFHEELNALPPFLISSSCVKAADIDNDGDLDLFVGGRLVPFKYPLATKSYILINESKNGQVKFALKNEKEYSELQNFGLITDALFTDVDLDNDLDILVAGDFAEPTFFINKDGQFNKQVPEALKNHFGYWSSINAADFNGDGLTDYVIGNLGKNLLIKCSPEKPAAFYSGDFDNNGVYDILPFCHYANEEKLVPYVSKEDMSKMYNPLRLRFTTYKEYASASIENVLTKAELDNAKKSMLSYTASVVLINKGEGIFEMLELPAIAQVAPIYGMLIDDFDQDSNLDILYIGNNYDNELMVGQLDASNGMLLKGNGKGGFTPILKSGFVVSGDARSLVSIGIGKVPTYGLLASSNDQKVKLFTSNKPFKYVEPTAKQKTARYTYKGKVINKELYRGSSYMSGSSSKLFFPKEATDILFK